MKKQSLIFLLACSISEINTSFGGLAQHFNVHLFEAQFSKPFVYFWNMPRTEKLILTGIAGVGGLGYSLFKHIMIDYCLKEIEKDKSLSKSGRLLSCAIRLNTTSEYFFSKRQLAKLKDLKHSEPEVFYWPDKEGRPHSHPGHDPLYANHLYTKEQLKKTYDPKADSAYQKSLKNN